MKKITIFFSALLLLVFTSCEESNKHFLKDNSYREKVHQQFLKRKDLAVNRNNQLFGVFEKEDLSIEKQEALEFLYAYMPLSDLADYDDEYFLKQVETAFQTRDYFKWGKQIPDDIFRHFVLVYRVNNENLDSARQVFFNELKDRIKDMTMEQAVLEVNHWCHEYVNYRGTDGRTSAPLALRKTSWGRCGEESTFTVVALRAVGIPARQCYTPRWVHTDDNHAWVEVWIDGKWHYIGACEPEPALDVAWFTAPAKRTMMVHTNVFGLYEGPEEKNQETDLYSVINLLANYTDTKSLKVKVVDKDNNPVKDAEVKFKVYNYAEFYPISINKTNEVGETSILIGLGSILVWANKGDIVGYTLAAANDKEVEVKIESGKNIFESKTFMMQVPQEKKIKDLPEQEIAENAKRLASEDSIRNTYMSTFISEEDAHKFAEENNLNADQVWNFLNKAQGNWEEIKSFILQHKESQMLFEFLASLSEKDLRDTPAAYLDDHYLADFDPLMANDKTYMNLFAKYISSPRIGLELIRPWRSFLNSNLPEQLLSAKTEDQKVNAVFDYINNNIKINEENYYNCPISPQGAFELKYVDSYSRDILFVALCRTLKVPARLEPSTSRPQYFKDNKWHDLFWSKQSESLPKASVIFTGAKSNIIKPAYYRHYTLARFVNGDFETLDFENDESLKNLPGKVMVDAGFYRLIIGSRANDGSVSVNTSYFDIAANQTKTLEIKLPELGDGLMPVQGIIDMNTTITLMNGEKTSLKALSNGKGIAICFADPDKEPTKHVLQDLPEVKQQFDTWGGGILFAVPNDKLSSAFDVSGFKNLPLNTHWSVDENRALLNSAVGALQIDFSNNFPLIVYLNSNGGILFSSQGYRIGLGESLIKVIEAEKLSK